MTLSRIKTWTTGSTVLRSDLDKEFQNIHSHFGKITASELSPSIRPAAVDFYVGNDDDDLVTLIAAAVAADQNLYLPPGTYESSSGTICDIPDNFIIEGAGTNQVTIVEPASCSEVIMLRIGNGTAGGKVILRNFTLEPNADSTHTLALVGLYGTAPEVIIEGVMFNIPYSTSAKIDGIKYFSTVNGKVTIDRCSFYSPGSSVAGSGFYLDALYGVRLNIINSVFYGFVSAVYINLFGSGLAYDDHFVHISGCYIYPAAASVTGLFLESAGLVENCVFYAETADSSLLNYIYWDNQTNNIGVVTGCLFYPSSTGYPTIGIQLNGDKLIAYNLTEAPGSSYGFSSGLISITGLTTTADEAFWLGLICSDQDKAILPAACTKRDARLGMYKKTVNSLYLLDDQLLHLDDVQLNLVYTSLKNRIYFRRGNLYSDTAYLILSDTTTTSIPIND